MFINKNYLMVNGAAKALDATVDRKATAAKYILYHDTGSKCLQ